MNVIYRRHRRSKNIRITIRGAVDVLVTYPWWVSREKAEGFVAAKAGWIEEAIKKIKKRGGCLPENGDRQDYLKNKEKARRLVYEKIHHFNQFYEFRYKRVAVRNQKTRWGSCSRDGNLNFSYRIIYLPETMVDYLVVHELCHLQELNHSKKFWQLVEKTIPDWKAISRELRNSF